jgi:hypothetical protein
VFCEILTHGRTERNAAGVVVIAEMRRTKGSENSRGWMWTFPSISFISRHLRVSLAAS